MNVCDLAACHSCTLLPQKRQEGYVLGNGPQGIARIVLVGEAPGATEAAQGLPFVGISGKLLDATLRVVGLRRQDVYVTNAVACHPTGNRTPTADEIDACAPRLAAEIESCTQRHVIVCLGNAALRAVLGKGSPIVHRNMGKVEWSERWGAFVISTWHPAACLRNVDYWPDLEWTLRKARLLLEREPGPIEPPAITWQYLDEKNGLMALAWLDELRCGSAEIACDIETGGENPEDGLNWLTGRILQVGFSVDENRAIILAGSLIESNERIRAAMSWLFANERIKWIWHNGKFDVKWLQHHWQMPARIDADTMLLHYLLDERGGGGEEGYGIGTAHGLKPLAMKFCDAPDWEAEVKQYKHKRKGGPTLAQAQRAALVKYHAYDVCYTLRLYHVLTGLLAEEPDPPPGCATLFDCHEKLLVPAANTFAETERYGVLIDVAYLRQLDGDMRAEMEQEERILQELATDIYKQHPIETFEVFGVSENPLNVRSPAQIAYILYDLLGLPLWKGERTTNKEALNAYKDAHPFVAHLAAYRAIEHNHKIYVAGLEKRLDAHNRLHTDMRLHGTVTGRLASSNPNLQNIPKDASIKKLFTAPPGWLFVEADYSQLEVRVWAQFSKDKNLIDALNTDLHWSVADQVFAGLIAEVNAAATMPDLEAILSRTFLLRQVQNKHHREPYATVDDLRKAILKHIRTSSKPVTFGEMYGRGPQALAEGELQCTLEEARQYQWQFRLRFQQAKRWMTQEMYAAFQRGFACSLTGRRRRFPINIAGKEGELQRQAINHPIQSFASDIALLAYIRLHAISKQRDDLHVLFPVHDAITFEVREDRLYEVSEIIRDVMENVVKRQVVPFPVEIKAGKRWGDAKELEARAGNAVNGGPRGEDEASADSLDAPKTPDVA